MGQKMVKLLIKFKSKCMQTTKKNYLGIDGLKLWFDVSMLVVVDHQKQPMITERFDNRP